MSDSKQEFDVAFKIDGYDVLVTIKGLEFLDDPIHDDENENPIAGHYQFDFKVLYDFQDQEAYEATHRSIKEQIPVYFDSFVKDVIEAAIEESRTRREAEVE